MAGIPYSNPWAAKKIRESITPASLETVANNKWRTHTHDRMGKPRFDATASKAWLDSYNKGFQKFDSDLDRLDMLRHRKLEQRQIHGYPPKTLAVMSTGRAEPWIELVIPDDDLGHAGDNASVHPGVPIAL